MLDEVAGDEDGVGRGRQRRDVAHGVGQPTLGDGILIVDVEVRQLGEQERARAGHAVVVSGRWRPTWPT